MPHDDTTAPPPPLRIGLPSRLGELLIRQGLVSSEEVQAALAEQAAGSEWRLGRLLVHRGALDDRTLVQAIAHQFHVQVVDLGVEPPTAEALGRLPQSAALQLRALPLRVDADALVVAVADPPVRELRVAIERSTGLPVRLVMAPADELAAALDRAYPGDAGDAGIAGPPDPGTWLAEPGDVTGAVIGDEIGEARDLRIVVSLLTEALRRDATAVHLDHDEQGARVRYRVDGAVVAGPVLPRASGTVVCHRLLAAACVDPADDGLHEGAFDTVVDGRSVTCRVTALTTRAGTHVVVRPEAPTRARRLEDLQLAAVDTAAMRAILAEGRGVVVVAARQPASGVEVCRTIADELGTDDHVVVSALDGGVAVRGAVVLPPSAGGDGGEAIGPVVPTALALGADALVVSADDAGTRRAVFDGASELLAVLHVSGDDPSDVVAELVDAVGGFLVAAMLRAVVVTGADPAGSTEVHLVDEDVCRAILDAPPGR